MLHIPPQDDEYWDERSLSKNGKKTHASVSTTNLKTGKHIALHSLSVSSGDNVPIFKLSEPARKKFSVSVEDLRSRAERIKRIPYKEYEYPFENIVFEGGGPKGAVYLGVMQVNTDL